jgi:SAM-dependent methyltransferase
MTRDDRTLGFYDSAAGAYADAFGPRPADADLLAFMDALPPGGRVLDLGCGPGHAAAAMVEAGFAVEATDASAGMIEIARTRFGLDVRQASFHDLDAVAHYDGVYANFSLLHAPRAEFPGHLARIHRALRPGGIFHLALKLGTGEARDRLGRFYSYYGSDELADLLASAGFTLDKRREYKARGMAGTDDDATTILAHA